MYEWSKGNQNQNADQGTAESRIQQMKLQVKYERERVSLSPLRLDSINP